MNRMAHALGVLVVAWIIWLQDVGTGKWQSVGSAPNEPACYARVQSVKDQVYDELGRKGIGRRDPGENRLWYYLSDQKPREMLFHCFPSDFDPRPR